MQEILNKVGLGQRILTLSAVPMLIAAILAVNLALDAKRVSDEAEALDSLVQHAPYISAVVHELQKERGASAGFIGSGGVVDRRSAMLEQRQATDRAMTAFQQADSAFSYDQYGSEFVALASAARQELAKLQRTRQQILNMERTVPEMAAYYTPTIARMLDIIKGAAKLSANADVTRQITAYIGLLEAKERAGQERAFGNGGYASGQFTDAAYVKFAQLIEAQNSFLSSFQTFTTPEMVAVYDRTVRGSAVNNVQDMRDYVFQTKGAVNGGPYTSAIWFGEITKKIDLLKQVEDRANAEVLTAAKSLADQSSSTFWTLVVAVLAGIGILASASVLVFRSVSTPLRGIQGAMQELADGNLKAHVPYIEYGSSVGEMAKAVYAFKQNGLEAAKLADEARKNELAQREAEEAGRKQEEERARQENERALAEAAEQERRAERIDQLTSEFDVSVNSAMAKLDDAINDLGGTSQAMEEQAQTTQAESNEASSAANQTNNNVQTVASAAEQLASSISEISRQMSESQSVSEIAVSQAETASSAVAELAESSQKIGEVVNLINEIAEQTNLLALNATIEAARAGDAGKGFAVVASEVKALANQTAKATSDIEQQVQAMRGVSENVSEAVGKIGEVISQTNQISSSVAAAVEEQGAATGEISRNVQEANQGTQQVSGNIQTVLSGASNTKEAASRVKSASEELSGYGKQLKTLVDTFLGEIKTV